MVKLSVQILQKPCNISMLQTINLKSKLNWMVISIKSSERQCLSVSKWLELYRIPCINYAKFATILTLRDLNQKLKKNDTDSISMDLNGGKLEV